MKPCHSRGHIAWVNVGAPTFTFLGHFLQESRNYVIFANFETTPLILLSVCNSFCKDLSAKQVMVQLADWYFLKLFDIANLDGGDLQLVIFTHFYHKKLRPGTALKYIIKMLYIIKDIIYHNIVMFITLVMVKTFSLW